MDKCLEVYGRWRELDSRMMNLFQDVGGTGMQKSMGISIEGLDDVFMEDFE